VWYDDEGKGRESSRIFDISRRKLQKRKLGLSAALGGVSWVVPRAILTVLSLTPRYQMRIGGTRIPIRLN
jgi:hypothetical protein